MSEQNNEPKRHDNDDLFVGPDPEAVTTSSDLASSDFDSQAGDIASEVFEEFADELESPEEALYRSGPSAPARKNRGPGRPTKEEVKRRQVRDRVRKFRAKQPTSLEKRWAENLAALDPTARAELLQQQELCFQLNHEMNKQVLSIATNQIDDCDLVYELLSTCIKLDGFELVTFWCPDGSANDVTADEWLRCDDEVYRDYGLRTRIVRLAFREFLRWANRALVSRADHGPVAEEIKATLESMDPPKEPPKYIPEAVAFVPEAERQRRITEKEIVTATIDREKQLLEDWNCRLLREQMGQGPSNG